ncbi:MAG: DUF2490 domain-containing protein [Daejeonella sp.]|uniref:DUF2490 domain-containing protein n=1 Tax=Daejeonella sp. TaxID=2805397 RepID=UPI003C719B66
MILFVSLGLSAQTVEKKVEKQTFSLFSFSSTVQISPRWSIMSDVQERIFLKPVKQNQLSLRTQVNYILGHNWTAAGGTSYVLTHPIDPSSFSTLVIPEVRLNQDINYKQKFTNFSVGHRYRMEERFIKKSINDSLTEGYKFIERLSYTLSFEYKLVNSKNNVRTLILKATDGIFINAKKHIAYTTFDQNRFYTGLNYQMYKNVTIEMGYINIFQRRNSDKEFINRDIASFSVNHKLNNNNPKNKQRM